MRPDLVPIRLALHLKIVVIDEVSLVNVRRDHELRGDGGFRRAGNAVHATCSPHQGCLAPLAGSDNAELTGDQGLSAHTRATTMPRNTSTKSLRPGILGTPER